MDIKLPPQVFKDLRCPACKGELKTGENSLACLEIACQKRFPIVGGVPVLINESNSIFLLDDFVSNRTTTLDLTKPKKFKRFFTSMIPSITKNVKAKSNYQKLDSLVRNRTSKKILIVGCGVLGDSLEVLLKDESISIVESDVSFGPRANIICDGHDLPFSNDSFDVVIIQAVLEHVLDPYRCVEEIYRVLKNDGLVYAETPFMQQVHMRQYDFTRFTHLGHRRLFRRFKEIDSGAGVGPGTALAWSYQYFLLSFTQRRTVRKVIVVFASITSFYLKFFDYFLLRKPSSLDAASGLYFLGQKSDTVLTDKELLTMYRGGM
jgi:ubiquinone/menaquinone biosynthesis C-methylase UbiE